MLSFSDAASLEAAAQTSLPSGAVSLIRPRLDLYRASDLLDLTHLLVIQRGDDERSIYNEIGFHPLINPVDGCRYGDPGFVPHWEWLAEQSGWFEMIVTVGNEGFAYILLIQNDPEDESELLRLCREYTRPNAAI